MGWEYVIGTQEPAVLPDMIQRLAASLTYGSMYSLKQYSEGFILERDDASWPRALEVWLEEASGLEEIADGERYIYCLFHIAGEEGRVWRQQLEGVTSQFPEIFEWFEL
ncbi:hypothetical protein [Paenibacillus sp. FSL R7-0652]|jgi:hypothetical protein|uniref:Integron gene cassette protein n=1 Tax=Paenibacillus sp. AN1007 TaxID=3151385 RepID=A0AAU8NDU6_9BACL